jgi:hypothetical protein
VKYFFGNPRGQRSKVLAAQEKYIHEHDALEQSPRHEDSRLFSDDRDPLIFSVIILCFFYSSLFSCPFLRRVSANNGHWGRLSNKIEENAKDADNESNESRIPPSCRAATSIRSVGLLSSVDCCPNCGSLGPFPVLTDADHLKVESSIHQWQMINQAINLRR